MSYTWLQRHCNLCFLREVDEFLLLRKYSETRMISRNAYSYLYLRILSYYMISSLSLIKLLIKDVYRLKLH